MHPSMFYRLLTSMTDELDRLNPSRSAAKLGDRTAAVGTATGVVTGQTRSKRARHLNWKTI